MKRAFTLVEFVVVVAILLILATILFPVFSSHHYPNRRAQCQSNLKQIGLGFAQYVQDYNEKFPPVHVANSIGWADVIQPYVKSTQIFQCPLMQNSVAPLTDYYYNRRSARVTLDKFESVAQTILTGEGDDDGPTWVSFAQMPDSWKTDENSPAWRHLEGANYGFADGHVKWLKPSRINSTFSDKGYPTFALAKSP